MTAQEYYATMQQGNPNVYMPSPAAPAQSPAPTQIATPKDQKEFDALPNGTFYIEPDDGHIYQKGNKHIPKSSNPKGVEA